MNSELCNSVDLRLVTVKRACAQTGISRATFYRMMKRGELRRYKVREILCLSMDELERVALKGGLTELN